MNSIKAKNQLEKRLDGMETGGSGSGVGIFVNEAKNAERFNDYRGVNDKYAGDYSHTEGYSTVATGKCSHAEGEHTQANADDAHAEGGNCKANGDCSHAEGSGCVADGDFSHSEGSGTEAGGDSSHAEGSGTLAQGKNSHAEGSDTTANGYGSHAEGRNCWAASSGSHAEGEGTKANGLSSHSEGGGSVADGECSHAGGLGTIAAGTAQTAIGMYNAKDETALFIVGCGASDSDRKNALLLDRNGNLRISGKLISTDDEEKKNYIAGDGVDILDNVISVKLGNGLEFDSSGAIALIEEENPDEETGTGVYSAGDGIEIISDEESEKISVKVGEGLEIDENGAVSSMINADNAIIIQEADAKYLLHNYTQLDYIKGNRIVYGGPYNQIILQGHICYGLGGIAPNGITIGVGTYVGENASEIPDVPLYQKVIFSPAAYIGTIGVTVSLEMRLVSMTSSYAVYAMRYTCEDGKIIEDFTFYNYDGYSGVGFGYAWGTIFPPGSVYHGRTYEYGGAICRWTYRCKSSASAYKWYVNEASMYDAYIPFASEAEYNAAVGLTYEPVEMTEVQETVTEV